MGIIEKLKDFNSQTLSDISYNLCKWFNFDKVNVSYSPRSNVETGMWIEMEITFEQMTYHISGSTIAIVKKRLIELLERIMHK